MSEPLEIVDPLERFMEARDAVSAGIETGSQGRETRNHQTLWLVGAAVFAISTLILVDSISPRIGGEFASESASDTPPQHHMSSRQPGSDLPDLPVAPPRAQSVHAIDPGASATPSSESQLQPNQNPAPLSVTSGRQVAAVESSPSAQLKDQRPATAEVTEAPSHPELGDQLFKITSAVSIRSSPAASADIIGMAYAGTMARVASRSSGWTQIVDPSSGKTGWIDSTALLPLPTVDTASIEDSTPKQMYEHQPAGVLNEPAVQQGVEMPDENALPAVKAKKHGSKRHYGRRAFPFRFALRLFRR